jgi:hypothetical protein
MARCLGIVVALGALLAPTAATAPSPQRALTITPSVIDTVARPGDALASIRIDNSTPVTFQIRVYLALVHQRLDGSLVIRERRQELAGAERLFNVGPDRLVLPPGRAASVAQKFVRTPQGHPGAYAATVVEAVPPTTKRATTAYRLRLLGALLVTTPGAPAPRGRIEQLRVTQVGRRTLGFCIRLANTGPVHGYPDELRLEVRRADQVVFSTAPRGGVVLPGYKRDIGAHLFSRLRPGRYTVRASGRFGTGAIQGSAQFTLGGLNRLVAPKPVVGCTAR